MSFTLSSPRIQAQAGTWISEAHEHQERPKVIARRRAKGRALSHRLILSCRSAICM